MKPPGHWRWVLLLAYGFATPALADDGGYEVGARALVLLGTGVPANDMPGAGVVARWQWRPGWYFAGVVDRVSFDFERPYEIIGVQSTDEVDAKNEWTRVGGSIERRYDLPGGKWAWFWTAGAGWASVSAGEARGTTPTGGTFDIVTEADDELHLMLNAGVRWRVAGRFSLTGGLHLERHDVSYLVTDRVSGATGRAGSQTPTGVSIGFDWAF